MKHLRKIMALVLSLAMVLVMNITAFATEGTTTTGTFTITAPAGEHQYEIYQIFTGDLKDKTLSNIKWGRNGKETEGSAVSEEVLNDLKTVAEPDKVTGKDKTDREKLNVVTKYADLTNNETKKPVATITNGARYEAVPGYYLIKDADNSVTEDDAYTTYLVKVVGAVIIKPKSAKPSVDKQVWDENGDAEDDATDGWGESADHAINESFQFKLIATIPDDKNMDAYDHYYLNFEDVMGKGVTFEKIDSVTVTPKDSASDSKTLNSSQYAISSTDSNIDFSKGFNGPATWNISIIDLKAYLTDIKGATITVIYSAHLNEEAEVTNSSNTEGTTNNQNKVALEYSNNPNATGNGKEKPDDTGKTKPDYVFVLTYEADNTKYKNEIKDENVLSGAGFKLYSDITCKQEILLKKHTDGFYYPIATGESGEEMFSANDGKFNIKGLDAGTYYLKETSTPDGFNTIGNMKIEISATHKEMADPTKVAVKLTKKVNDKKYDVNKVVNKSGSLLPETGGIGTTIFYIVGVVLVLGAGVLLVTKKRMNADK